MTRLQGKGRVIAVNAAGYAAPWADLLVFTDSGFYTAHRRMVDAFQGDVWTMSRETNQRHSQIPRVMVDLQAPVEAGTYPVRYCASSGQYGLALAMALGADRVGLLGMDMKLAKDGRSHCHAHYGAPNSRAVAPGFLQSLRGWGKMAKAAGVWVINFSPESACAEFQRMPLDAVFGNWAEQ